MTSKAEGFTEIPISIRVRNLLNFARLVLALTDSHQIVWRIRVGNKQFLAFFTAYSFWKEGLLLLAYTDIKTEDKPFLAYRSDTPNGEEFKFRKSMDDLKYKYASLVELEEPPELISKALTAKHDPPLPIYTPVRDCRSIMRLLLALTLREGTNIPIWHFKKGRQDLLGTYIPFEYNYDSSSFPMFMYFKPKNPPSNGFLKYRVSEAQGEQVEFSNTTRDTKYFYAKIISVDSFPLTHKMRL